MAPWGGLCFHVDASPRAVSSCALGLFAGCGLVTLPGARTNVPRIGYLGLAPPDAEYEAFRGALHELGYVEGQTITIEERQASSTDQLPALADELVRLPADVIVAGGYPALAAVLHSTHTIPIVFPASGDPVQAGFVASLARPGGNATGLSNVGVKVAGKRLDLLHETVPGASRIMVLTDTADPANTGQEQQAATQALGLQLLRPTLTSAADLPTAFEAAVRDRAEALLVSGQPFLVREHGRIIEFAAQQRLPTLFDRREPTAEGGLMSYGPNIEDLFRRSATYVDKILKGAAPADLPVEQPTKFDLVINLKTAQALGLTIPASVLTQATEVIE